jgi:two-component system, OmpR family, alkaline phosphatase synthesis response regulator PhoP
VNQKKILVIEDEANISELIRYNLTKEGFKVECALDGQQGIELAIKLIPDILILDLMLPSLDGMEICKILKQNYKTQHIAIIVLSAKNQEADVLLAFQLGVDDYITKPFSIRQLTARIKAILKRKHPVEKFILAAGSLEMDTAAYTVKVGGEAVSLTSKEYGILKLFMEAPGRVFYRGKMQ